MKTYIEANETNDLIEIKLKMHSSISIQNNIEIVEYACPQSVLDFAEIVYNLIKERHIITVFLLPNNQINKVAEYKIKQLIENDSVFYDSYITGMGKIFVVISKNDLPNANFNVLVTRIELYTKGFSEYEQIFRVLKQCQWDITSGEKEANIILNALAQIHSPAIVIHYALDYVKICINSSKKKI